MFVLTNICFVCLTDTNRNMMVYKERDNKAFTHIKYALPELAALDSIVPPYICVSCSIQLEFFYTFKKKCLNNYSRWKHYIQILQETNTTQEPKYSNLQVNVADCEWPIKQEPVDMDFELNINQQNKVQFTVVDDNNVITDNIDNEEQNIQQTDAEDYTEEEWLEPEHDNADQVNITYEIISDDEQDGGQNKTNSSINTSPELKCLICDEIFPDNSSLYTHMCVHINNATGSECLICKKTLAPHQSLKLHMKAHLGMRDFECTICHRKYLRASSLGLHMKIHGAKRHHECQICNKKFVRNCYLKNHMLKHSDMKECYECTVCSKKYLTKKLLKIHLTDHADINEFECAVCKKKFLIKYILNYMKPQLGIKDYHCPVCSKNKQSFAAKLKLT